jgi:hypothetical protein
MRIDSLRVAAPLGNLRAISGKVAFKARVLRVDLEVLAVFRDLPVFLVDTFLGLAFSIVY